MQNNTETKKAKAWKLHFLELRNRLGNEHGKQTPASL